MIRPAGTADVPVVVQLIKELAAYEREPDAAQATEEDLHAALFGAEPVAACHVGLVDGAVVGFALWYRTFSTWQGQPGLWLEDLFVRPEARGTGLGKALLVELARTAVARGWTRFEWWVLDWNEPAHGFYRALGARPEDAWTVWRLDGPALEALAADRCDSGRSPVPSHGLSSAEGRQRRRQAPTERVRAAAPTHRTTDNAT